MSYKKFATIVVIGRDKSGVVARVSSWLFQNGANIEALEEQVTRGQFSMTIQASWKAKKLDPANIRAGLAQVGRRLGMEVSTRFTEPQRQQRVAVFVTRESHCLEALLSSFQSGELKAEARLVIGNYPDLRGVAAEHKVSFVHLPWETRAGAELKALALLQEHEVDLVVLARFMKILSPTSCGATNTRSLMCIPLCSPAFLDLRPIGRPTSTG